jgi:hypothetical protein
LNGYTNLDPVNGCDMRPAWWHRQMLRSIEFSERMERAEARGPRLHAEPGRSPSWAVRFPPAPKRDKLVDSVERPAWWYEKQARTIIPGDLTDDMGARPFDERFPPTGPLSQVMNRGRARVVARIPQPAKRPRSWRKTPERSESFGDAHTYVIAADGLGLVKIGIANNPEARRRFLQTGQPMDLHLLWSVEGAYEVALHKRFEEYRTRGEWFDLRPLGDPVEVVTAAINEILDESPPF